MIVFGVGVIRAGLAPRLAGLALAVGAPVFAILGVALADIVQTVGAVLLVVGTVWLAWAARRQRALDAARAAVT